MLHVCYAYVLLFIQSLNHQLCDIFNEKQRTCRTDVYARMSAANEGVPSLQCECRPQCNEVSFEHESVVVVAHINIGIM